MPKFYKSAIALSAIAFLSIQPLAAQIEPLPVHSSELQPSSTSQALPFQLPAPSGQYKVGTTTYYWVDDSRRETYSAEIYDLQTQSLATTPRPTDRRELIVYVWYPASAAQGAATAPYIAEGFALATADFMGSNFGVSSDQFVQVVTQTIQTNTVPKAKLAGASRYPVVIFSPGFGATPKVYTKQLEELASYGYVVVAINPTYEAPVLFPDGQVITQSLFDFSSANSGTEQQVFNQAVEIRAEDVSFVLNELERINREEPQNFLTGRLNLSQVGIFGHSLGGDTTIEAMKRDRRLKAGINMDGGSYGSLFASGNSDSLDRPFMVMSHDGADESLQSFYQRLKGNAYRLTIEGSKHATFTDIGLILPAFSTNSTARDKSQIAQAIGSIEPQRATQIISVYTLAFFNQYLKGEDEPLLEKISPDYPEVLIESRS